MTIKEGFYNHFKSYLPAFILLLAFFVLTLPGNTSDADDAYTFARMLRDNSFSEVFLPRFPLFLPVSKILFGLLQSVHKTMDAHSFLVYQSLISGSLVVILVHFICRRYLEFSRRSAVFCSLFLLFSFSFWRYSLQAELYITSMLLILLYVIQIFRLRLGHIRGMGGYAIVITLGILCILYYKPNVIPVLITLPWLLYETRFKWRALIIAGGIFLSTIFVLGLIALLIPEYSFSEYLYGGRTTTEGKLLAALAIVGSNTVSLLWIFSMEEVANFADRLLPNKVLVEEYFLSNNFWLPGWFFMVLLAVLVLGMIGLLIRNREAFSLMIKARWWNIMLLWLGLYAVMLLYYDPSSAEPWIMIQLPLVLILSPVLSLNSEKQRSFLVGILFLVILFFINLMGGMLPLRDKSYDYVYQRSRMIIAQMTEEDIVMTFGPKSAEEYLRYYSPARIINLEEDFDLAVGILKNGTNSGRLVIFDDVLNPAPAFRYRMSEDLDVIDTIISNNYTLDTLNSRDDFSIYILKKN